MEIPLPQSTTDIYAYGYDKSLNKGSINNSSIVYDIMNQTEAQTVQFGALIAGSGNNSYQVSPDQGMWMGAEKFADAPFSVDMQGNLIANSASISFGGNSSDGALSISSGTTTLNMANAAVYTRNYSSISITGTGQLTFSNPATTGTTIILKCKGDCTITSTASGGAINATGMGAAGGAAGAVDQSGTAGTEASGIFDGLATHFGGAGIEFDGGGTGGAGGTAWTSPIFYTRTLQDIAIRRTLTIAPGSGGGGGSGSDNTWIVSTAGGAGGNGGGCVILEIAGALNFGTGASIEAKGVDGSPGVDASGITQVTAGAGGGGGAGGFVVVLYNTLTANNGTINTSGGTGGKGGDATKTGGTSGMGYTSGAGGGGGMYVAGGGGGAMVGADAPSTPALNGNPGSAGAAGGGGGGGGSGAIYAQAGNGSTTGGAGGAGGNSTGNYIIGQNPCFA